MSPQPQVIATAHYDVTIGHNALQSLPGIIAARNPGQVLVVADTNTALHCLPRLEAVLGPLDCMAIPAGEQYKQLETVKAVWARLTENHAGRNALLINLGGGLVGDLGGFAAACYKRGLEFIQVPTSLLAMVDASVGGKTGVNFMGYKNQIGAFQDPVAVLVDPAFLQTLPARELRAGFAEVLKHCLIADARRWEVLIQLPDLPSDWETVIADSISIKTRIVAADPLEHGPRAALNFGHTVGHALESHSLAQDGSPLLHGEAVAYGMVCEAWLSWHKGLLSETERDQVARTMVRIFGNPSFSGEESDGYRIPAIAQYALQDKKNQNGEIHCALLDGIGAFRIAQAVTPGELLESLHYLRSLA